MKRKRKNKDDRVDEVEDGGRAKVVEELVIKADSLRRATSKPRRKAVASSAGLRGCFLNGA